MAFSPKAWSFYCFNTKSEVVINPSNLSKPALKLSTMQLLVSLRSALGLPMLLSVWFLEALFVYVQLGNSQKEFRDPSFLAPFFHPLLRFLKFNSQMNPHTQVFVLVSVSGEAELRHPLISGWKKVYSLSKSDARTWCFLNI